VRLYFLKENENFIEPSITRRRKRVIGHTSECADRADEFGSRRWRMTGARRWGCEAATTPWIEVRVQIV
jgi:hypothetical protein